MIELSLRWGPPRSTDAKRLRLERAVVEEISETHFQSATVAGVCRRCDLDPEYFHAQFDDLEDAYCEVFHRLVAELLERALPAFAEEGSWREGMRSMAYELFRYMAEDRVRGRFIASEVLAAGERAQSLRDQGLALMSEVIDRGREELPDPELVSRATAEAIAGTVYRTSRIALENDNLDPFALLPSLLYNTMLPYVGAAEALRELTIIPPRAIVELDRARLSREAILEAVLAEVRASGHRGARIDSIRERAGASEDDFGAYFVDLEDALCQTLESIDQEIVARIQSAVAEHRRWRDQLRAAAYALAGYLAADLPRARFLLVESAELGERARLIRYDALQVSVDLIDQGRGELADPDSIDRRVAERGAVALFGKIVEIVEAGHPVDPEPLVRSLLSELLVPYVGEEEARRELGLDRPRPGD